MIQYANIRPQLQISGENFAISGNFRSQNFPGFTVIIPSLRLLSLAFSTTFSSSIILPFPSLSLPFLPFPSLSLPFLPFPSLSLSPFLPFPSLSLSPFLLPLLSLSLPLRTWGSVEEGRDQRLCVRGLCRRTQVSTGLAEPPAFSTTPPSLKETHLSHTHGRGYCCTQEQ